MMLNSKMKPSTAVLVALTILTLTTFEMCVGIRILAIFPTVSYSHHIWNTALVSKLAERGHSVVSLSPFAQTSASIPNVQHVLLEDSFQDAGSIRSSLLERASFSARQHADAFFQCCFDVCRQQLQSNGSKYILNVTSNEASFDVLILESFGFECFYGFIHRLNIPTIAVSAHGHTPWNCQQMGIPQMTAVHPLEMLSYQVPMTLMQRAYNSMLMFYMHVRRQYEYLSIHETTARQVFGADMPSLRELESRFNLFLVNAGPHLDMPRPLPPAVIEVGCLHCRPGGILDQATQEFLDGAEHGAIYFSLGSNVPSHLMPPDTLNAFVQVFSSLPQRILWKWGSEEPLPNKPDNVKLSKWLSQQDVLAHSKLRLFITHGGRLSSQEAVHHGVPVLVIPIYYDQYMHGQRAEQLGIGLRLNFKDVNEITLGKAMHTILSNQTFLYAARNRSLLSRDQPETPLERAVFWTEYVVRHQGASHLRTAALGLSWYQLYLLDVAAVLVATACTLCSLCCLFPCTARRCLKCLAPRRNAKQKRQ